MNFKHFRIAAFVLCLALLIGFMPQTAHAAETISIVHINDIHGNAIGDPLTDEDGNATEDGKIGLARIATYLKQARANGNVLFLDAGDTIHGTNFASLSEGRNMVQVLNEMELDAITPGNHDFNYGYQQLHTLTEDATFNILAANVTKDGDVLFEDNTIFTVGDKKIGVFGMATPETQTKSNPLNTQGLVFEDVVETAKAQIAALNEQNVDAIIMLSHLGMDAESKINTYTVLDAVEGIDVVIDGHSHTLLENGQDYKGTLIASANEYTKYFGQVDLTFNGDDVRATAKVLNFDDMKHVTPDQTVTNLINELNKANEEVLNRVVGKTENNLDGERNQVRTGETNLGNLLTDAMLEETGADFAFTNGGGIRASIAAGDITVGDIFTVLPFGNAVTVIEVTGQEMIDAMKFGFDAWPDAAGKLPHVAGLNIVLTPNSDGNEVKVLVDGQPLDPNKTYKLATNDFIAVGGDGYTMFEGANQVSLHGLLSEVLENFIREKETVNYNVEGRITTSTRIAGANRIDTAIRISQENFETASSIVLVNGSDKKLVDALTAAPLAKMHEAPILLTNETMIPENVIQEINRLTPSKVFVIGGEASIKAASLNGLEGMEIIRLAGNSRYETADAIANHMGTDSMEMAYLASGENFADALSLANLATRYEGPILLTRKNAMTDSTKAILENAEDIILAGGPNSVSEDVVAGFGDDLTRLFGADRYATAVEVAKRVEADNVAIASGRVAADALAVGPVLANNNEVLLLTEKDTIPAVIHEYVKTMEPQNVTIYGGSNTVSNAVDAQFQALTK